jgi:hypothetical protein
MPTSVPAGTYSVIARSNPDLAVDEDRTGNNIRARGIDLLP